MRRYFCQVCMKSCFILIPNLNAVCLWVLKLLYTKYIKWCVSCGCRILSWNLTLYKIYVLIEIAWIGCYWLSHESCIVWHDKVIQNFMFMIIYRLAVHRTLKLAPGVFDNIWPVYIVVLSARGHTERYTWLETVL